MASAMLENKSEDSSEDTDEETETPDTSDFPRRNGYFSKVELVKLALCIGFNVNLFTLHFTHFDPQQLDEPGVTTEQVLDLLYIREFKISIHKTMNLHSQEYNERLIRRVVKLLQEEKIGFSELKDMSRVFSLYELKDEDGMTSDWVTIMSALKMCDRVMSSLQLKNEITKRADVLEIPKRMTLYELIDFYLVSQSLSYWREEITVPELPKGIEILPFSEDEKIFTLSLPNELEGLQYDRILTRLNNEYRMLLYQPVKTQPQKLNVVGLVNSKLRLNLFEKSQAQLKEESRKYMRAEQNLWKARAGRQYYSSAPLVEKKRKKGTVVNPHIDLRQMDLDRTWIPFAGPPPTTERNAEQKLSEKEEQMIDLSWEMIRSNTKYEKLIQSLREKRSANSSQEYDLIPNIFSSLNLTLQELQSEIKVPAKAEKTRNLSPKRKQQIRQRFGSLDSSYIEQMLESWVKT